MQSISNINFVNVSRCVLKTAKQRSTIATDPRRSYDRRPGLHPAEC